MKYNEYTVCVGNDSSNYGHCTHFQAVQIANKIEAMIAAQFPGINIIRTEESGAPTPTRGPSSDVIDEINDWVSDNWTAAL